MTETKIENMTSKYQIKWVVFIIVLELFGEMAPHHGHEEVVI